MEIIALDRKHEALVKIVLALKQGGVVALPTDTVYGLCADTRNADAVAKIFAIKMRQTTKALPVFIRSFEALDEVAYVRDKQTRDLLARLWPGKVTALLPSRGWMPLALRGGSLHIGVRLPAQPFLLDILKNFHNALTATSANISGREACTSAQMVKEQFSRFPLRPDYIVDGGTCSGDVSTIIDCAAWPPAVVRRGAVSEAEICRLAQNTKHSLAQSFPLG